MWKKSIRLLLGFGCGYLFILMFPIDSPFNLSEFLLEFVINPFSFFAASIVFIVGFISNALIIKEGVEETYLLYNQKESNLMEIIFVLLLMVSFYVLFQTGFWQTMVFFCFSILYGIISLDFRRFKMIEE
ncbi:hypothetical protein EKG37_12950 [Robertmurraya yapensis]|uniref:Uncharacterized protein n=2 Tax=Bacillaceae TaxID=186817 RepID=A0A3S0KMX1_9BACI|nr:hypothetical protein [Bacillus yapensis]RTR30406.1 hypothetical protein EKG37_12950 [Bacillus yapensis]TKS95225.1 hypothetical protein FAR12_12950 [Bacillus yapensis]